MPRLAVPHVRDAITLPFLFETQTILRLPLRTPGRLLSASASRVTDEEKSPSEAEPSSFLKAKARVAKSKPISSRFRTSITAAERRVFDDIFNHVTTHSPSKNTSTPQKHGERFLDNENI